MKKIENNQAKVKKMLMQNSSGGILSTVNNYITIMKNDNFFAERIRYNEFTNAPEKITADNKIERWEDFDANSLIAYIEKHYTIMSKTKFEIAFSVVLKDNKYNPLKEIIEAIQWDGIPRIETMLIKHMKCEDMPYTREVSRLIFHGGISRLYYNGIKFDLMPILIGKQGCGKSTFVRWLALNDKFFNEIKTIEEQKGAEAIDGYWICEFGELLALSKTKEIEAIKAYITCQDDKYRRPFAKNVSQNPRKCIFLGTTNRTEFLTDKTGNRRFLPVSVGNLAFDNEKEIKADIAQCWAEALSYYNLGITRLTISDDLMQEVEERQLAVVEDDWREGVIAEYLTHKTEVSAIELWCEALGFYKDKYTKKDANEIVQIMANCVDWIRISTPRKTTKYGNQRIWERKPSEKSIKTPLKMPKKVAKTSFFDNDKNDNSDELPY